ncbi:MAG: hypothetical protein ACRDZ2_11810, partial [Ilumatobacteraceae bacterium]
SDTDLVLVQLLRHFDSLDLDGDGEVTGAELKVGLSHPNADVRAASEHLLARPLVALNVAMADGPWSFYAGSQDVDIDEVAISTTAITMALAQNRIVRALADPVRFAALDRATTGEIDGAVSAQDVRRYLEQQPDPDGDLQLMLDTGFLDKIDREGWLGDSNGTVAYDQVYALGTHQGAFDGLPDPAIPAALRDQLGPPEPTGDRTAQFLHHPIEPQPGMGQVMISLFISTGLAGAPGPHIGKSTGNDRGPDPHAHPSDSKGWAIVDYETGLVTVRVNPSCSASDHDACHDPLPITTEFPDPLAVPMLLPVDGRDHNRVGVAARPDATGIRFGIINADKQFVAPRLDARFDVRTHEDGTASVEWSRDDFPDLEIYHLYPDGRVVQLVHAGASSALPSLFGFDRAHGNVRG